MLTQNEIVEELLGFYYFAYNKLVSYPFLYSELIPTNVDCFQRDTQLDCKCCAIRKQELLAALSICMSGNEITDGANWNICRDGRLPTSSLKRAAAQSFDVDELSKDPEILLAQLYIVCVVLEMRQTGGYLDTNCESQKLVPFFKKSAYISKKKRGDILNRNEEDITVSGNCYSQFMQRISSYQGYSNGHIDLQWECHLELLDEAVYDFVQLHENDVRFHSVFSKKMCFMSMESEDKNGFEIET